MAIVLDASAALDFAFEEGDGPAIDGIIAALANEDAFVPQHWRLEVANGLATRIKRRVLDPADTRALLRRLGALNLTTDDNTCAQAWSATFDLAEKHRLTSYDAAYLELAVRLNADLATFDLQLIQAARLEGVSLVIERSA